MSGKPSKADKKKPGGKKDAPIKKSAPSTLLDKIVHAIRALPPGSNGGVSRVSIAKYLKSEFSYDSQPKLKQAFKRGVTAGRLIQHGQSFAVEGDDSRKPVDNSKPLQMEDLQVGKGDTATVGDAVTVAYVGKLDDGTQFDAAKSFTFVLGAGEVIKGWDQGVAGMAVGGKRKLVVPSKLGYGKRGCSPDIPPNATLHFHVTMKKISSTDDD